MIIDIHTHLGRIDTRDYRINALVDYMRVCNIDAALVSHSDRRASGDALDEVDANLACLEACRGLKRLRPLYWLRPGFFDSNPHAFAGALKEEAFVGVMLSPSLHGYSLDDLERLTPYFGVLSELNLPAIISLSPTTPVSAQHLHMLARHWPTLPFVLFGAVAHVNRTDLLEMTAAAARRGDARIFVDTAHADAEHVLTAIEMAGVGHVLFGTNAGGDAEQHAIAVTTLLDELRKRLDTSEFDRIVGGTAQRLFKLRPGAAG